MDFIYLRSQIVYGLDDLSCRNETSGGRNARPAKWIMKGIPSMTEFKPVGTTSDFAASEMMAYVVDGREVVVAKADDRYFAFDGRCTCMSLFSSMETRNTANPRTPLSDGKLVDGSVTCPTHATVYRVDSGNPIKGPGEIPLNTYEVREEAGQLLVAVRPDNERRFWNDAKAA